MRIVAKLEGHCTSCGRVLRPGDHVEWERTFGSRCLICERDRKYPERTNRIGAWCYRCELFCAPGRGLLEPEGATDFKVRCKEKPGCDTRAERLQRDLQRPQAEA